jgi:hypothetical protein
MTQGTRDASCLERHATRARQEMPEMLQISGQRPDARPPAAARRCLTTHGIPRWRVHLPATRATEKFAAGARATALGKPHGGENQRVRITVVVRGFADGT